MAARGNCNDCAPEPRVGVGIRVVFGLLSFLPPPSLGAAPLLAILGNGCIDFAPWCLVLQALPCLMLRVPGTPRVAGVGEGEAVADVDGQSESASQRSDDDDATTEENDDDVGMEEDEDDDGEGKATSYCHSYYWSTEFN